MKQKIAIIGASYLQKPLALKAKEMNIETHCFAWAEGAVCKELCDFFYPISVLDKEEILNICEKIKITGILTIATDIAMPTVSYVANKLGLIANSELTAYNATNKGKMRLLFEKEHVKCPSYFVLNKNDVLPSNLKFPLIVKPTDRSGSRGINKVSQIEELKSSIKIAQEESISNTAIIEQYVEGREVSVEAISWKGEHYILAITDKETTGAPHFVELSHHQPSLLEPLIIKQIEVLTLQALNSLGVAYGASHTEIKINSEGELFVIEVGARMGGDFIGSHLVELSTGYDFLKGVIEVALNKFEIPVIEKKYFSGIYFLCSQTKHLLPFFKRQNTFDVLKNLNDNVLRSVENSNDRSGFIIYKSNSRVVI